MRERERDRQCHREGERDREGESEKGRAREGGRQDTKRACGKEELAIAKKANFKPKTNPQPLAFVSMLGGSFPERLGS